MKAVVWKPGCGQMGMSSDDPQRRPPTTAGGAAAVCWPEQGILQWTPCCVGSRCVSTPTKPHSERTAGHAQRGSSLGKSAGFDRPPMVPGPMAIKTQERQCPDGCYHGGPSTVEVWLCSPAAPPLRFDWPQAMGRPAKAGCVGDPAGDRACARGPELPRPTIWWSPRLSRPNPGEAQPAHRLAPISGAKANPVLARWQQQRRLRPLSAMMCVLRRQRPWKRCDSHSRGQRLSGSRALLG